MSRPVWASFGGKVLKNFVLGALWGSAAASVESILVNHTLHVGLQNPVSLLELIVNYAVYAGLGLVMLNLALEALARRRSGASRGQSRAEPPAARVAHRRHAASLAEAVVGSGLFVGALATYLQKGPWGSIPLRWPLGLAIGGAGIVAIVLIVRVLRRLSPVWMRTLRVALAVCVVAGFAWIPLFGPYTGLLRSQEAKAHTGGAKNILLIITDTLRADYLDCYGGAWNASPTIDRLAADGTLFENNAGQSTWTLPATSSILTGLYPSTHGAVATGLPLSSTAPTLAEVLQRAGYRTAAFTENAYIRPQHGFGRGFDYFWTYWLPWAFDGTSLYRVLGRLHLPRIEFTNKHAYVTIPAIKRPSQVNWDARVATDAVLAWLRKDNDTPFFAYIQYMGPHGPYGPREYLLPGERPSTRLTDYPRPMGGAYPLGEPAGRATTQEIEQMKKLYAADIRYVDYHLGRLIDWLQQTGKLDETLIVFTADHGEEFLDHGSWNHGSSAFNEVMHVPFILCNKGTVPAGLRIHALTRQIDLMPTTLDLVGLPRPKEVQGRSVRPLLGGETLDPEPAYVEVYPAQPKGSDIFALVEGRHKIVRVSLGDRSAVLLYDLENDPKELNNLADVAPALRDSLLVEMEKWDQIARVNSPLDPKRVKYFRSLGYINQ